MKIHWPQAHRERYQQEAEAAGLSLNEYVIQQMAALHGLGGPQTDTTSREDPGAQEELPLGA